MGMREALEARVEEHRLHRELDSEISPHIDEIMLSMAHAVIERTGSDFFTPVTSDYLSALPRHDAVNHRLTYLPPNPASSKQLDGSLDLVDLLLGDTAEGALGKFNDFAENHSLFERIENGETFIFPSNHLELQDQGFTLGLFHKSAREVAGMDRFEHFATIMVGRLLGYFKLTLTDQNVIDDVLRPAAGVLKTFPTDGGEAMQEDGAFPDLGNFRKACNARATETFEDLTESHTGRAVILAGGGAQDGKDAEGNNVINRFSPEQLE